MFVEHVTMNLKVKKYTSRVLGVVKEKYDLRDKAEALDKFAEMYGDELIERDVNDEIVREVIRSCDEHVRKYGFRKMSIAELREVCGA